MNRPGPTRPDPTLTLFGSLWYIYTEHLMHEMSDLMQVFNFFFSCKAQGSIFSPYCDSFWHKLSQYGKKNSVYLCIPYSLLPQKMWSLAWDHWSRAWDAQCMCTISVQFWFCVTPVFLSAPIGPGRSSWTVNSWENLGGWWRVLVSNVTTHNVSIISRVEIGPKIG